MKYKIYGENAMHPEITSSLKSLGYVYKKLGKIEDARKMRQKIEAMNSVL